MARTVTTHPLVKLQTQLAQVEKTMSSVLENAGSPEFVAGLQALKKTHESSGNKSQKMGTHEAEVLKLLQEYPGLAKDTLRYIKAELTKFKRYGMLKQLKSSSGSEEIVEKKAPKQPKSASATEVIENQEA